jgi:phosphopantetheine adenylyltransferase
VETVFIMTGDQYALTSSSLIRQVVSLGGDVKSLKGILPDIVVQRLQQKQDQHLLQRSGPDAPAT